MSGNLQSELSDKRYRDAHGHPLRATFYSRTGELPLDVRPGDHKTAKAVVTSLRSARAQCAPLTRSESARITKLIKRWERRASGRDIRFEVMGTKRGAPTHHQLDRMYRLGWAPEFSESVTTEHDPIRCVNCRVMFTPCRTDQKFCTKYCRTTYHRRTAS